MTPDFNTAVSELTLRERIMLDLFTAECVSHLEHSDAPTDVVYATLLAFKTMLERERYNA